MGFRLEEKDEEIERLMEENGVIREIYGEVVPKKVDGETFWCLYFYKAQKVIEAEEVRVRFVKRAIAEEEEELSWDVDDDDNINDYFNSHEGRDGFEPMDKESAKFTAEKWRERSGKGYVSCFWKCGDEGKVADHGSFSTSNLGDLLKRLSAVEEDEELTWDVEDDKDEHIQS
ncbi:uncharacterized protein LOC142550680 [Primulina tabacum]|uniref:uncharacterized protein LOC142550680 n=1 Tax=Primulina tabacum TaxID=48773 RepID=UPI003F59E7CD